MASLQDSLAELEGQVKVLERAAAMSHSIAPPAPQVGVRNTLHLSIQRFERGGLTHGHRVRKAGKLKALR